MAVREKRYFKYQKQKKNRGLWKQLERGNRFTYMPLAMADIEEAIKGLFYGKKK